MHAAFLTKLDANSLSFGYFDLCVASVQATLVALTDCQRECPNSNTTEGKEIQTAGECVLPDPMLTNP